jgi:long-chain acyl-CoA synthetase
MDEDGFLFLQGRRDDLIISGGVNVYPAEVEAVLAGGPGVRDVAVFGVEDDDWGQRVCAAVVGTGDEDTLRRHASERLAPYKRPKQYFFVDELPHTTTGKLLRRALPEAVGLAPSPPAPSGPPRASRPSPPSG